MCSLTLEQGLPIVSATTGSPDLKYKKRRTGITEGDLIQIIALSGAAVTLTPESHAEFLLNNTVYIEGMRIRST